MSTTIDLQTSDEPRLITEQGVAARVAAIAEPVLTGLGFRLVRERFAGHSVKIEMAVAIDGRRRFRGLLMGTEGAAARIRRDDAAPGEAGEVLLPIDEMAEARIVLSDDVIAQSLKRGKTQQREVR